jgi:hypothetical protein
MADFPKIVTRRLQATAKPAVHPDPNLLSAFAERSINQHERGLVLEHLAQCAGCREIVSLSAPASEVSSFAAAPVGSGWLRWPVLRWGALAACVVVVGAAVSLRHRESDRSIASMPAATLSEAKPSAEPSLSAQPELSAKVQPSQPSPYRDKPAAASTAAQLKSSAPPARLDAPHSPALAQAAASAPMDAKTAVMPSASDETVEVAEAPAPELVPGRAKDKDAIQDSQSSNADLAATGGPLASGRRFDALAPMQGTMLRKAAKADLVPRWTLGSDGTLQRSFDSGKTWETIPVSGQTSLRALAASGLDIWVGGLRGTLYHSSDAGQHWTQVQPAFQGEVLTGDIIGVEFTDLFHGKLTTSNQETWTTTDAGQTWAKQ